MDPIGSVEALWDDLEAKECTRAEELTEEAYCDQHESVAEAIAKTVEEGLPGAIPKGEGFEATHEDTVRDDEPDEDGQLLTYVISIRLEDFADQRHQRSCYDELDDDTDAVRDTLAQERDDHVSEGDDDGHRERHHDGRLELGGHSQC